MAKGGAHVRLDSDRARVPALGSVNRRNPGLTEAHLERQCSDFLALDGWRSLKTDPVSRKEWGKGFGEKGMCDRLYIRYAEFEPRTLLEPYLDNAQVMWIEWKTPRGKAAPHQRRWIEAERARGALVLLAGQDFPALYEAFVVWYRRTGLLRREGL
jgi:hypothetical protein